MTAERLIRALGAALWLIVGLAVVWGLIRARRARDAAEAVTIEVVEARND